MKGKPTFATATAPLGELRGHFPEEERQEGGYGSLVAITRELEQLGFELMLVPTGSYMPDAWTVACHLLARTTRIRTLVAIRPGSISPVLLGKMLTTLDHQSGGRVAVNIVTGSASAELRQDGDFFDHASRYERTAEFVEVLKGVMMNERFNYEGKHYRLAQEFPNIAPLQRPHPPIFVSGASDLATSIAAKYGDAYMMWAEPIELTKKRVADVRALAKSHGREPPQLTISFQTLVRETEELALEAAREALQAYSDADRAAMDEYTAAVESVGQKRLQAIATVEDGWVDRHLWAGLNRYMKGNNLLLLGSASQVQQRIADYVALGISTVFLRGYDYVDDMRIIGKHVVSNYPRHDDELR